MKKMNKTRVFTWILSAAPLVLVALFYSRLPERIPTHWGIDGGVNAYGAKDTLWYIAAMSPLLAAVFTVLPVIDPRKRSYGKFRGFYDAFCLVMMLFLLGMTGMIVSESLNPGRLSVERLVTVGCGLLFAFLGNMMPKVKSNFFMGIRTPWALSDTGVWNRTQRLGGQIFFFGGLLMIACAFALNGAALFVLVMAVALAGALIPSVMSYVWYRGNGNGENKE